MDDDTITVTIVDEEYTCHSAIADGYAAAHTCFVDCFGDHPNPDPPTPEHAYGEFAMHLDAWLDDGYDPDFIGYYHDGWYMRVQELIDDFARRVNEDLTRMAAECGERDGTN